jgi:Zn-dependent peptidase ImmA (M78 family)
MHFEPSQSPKETEDQANQFAGEFLAPAHELKLQLWGLDFQKLAGLKQYWKISMQALIMRAYRLGAITDRQRREMFMRLSKAGYRLREPAELDPAIEPPVMCYRLIKFHQENLDYDEIDIYQALAINESDLKAFYRNPLDRLAAIK